MNYKFIKIGCMNDKPVDSNAKCYRVVTKVLINKTYSNVYDSYRSMASSHEVRRYRQIYAGMSSDERQCITCDVDVPFEESAVEEVKQKCSLHHIPLPTNIVVNLENVPTRPLTDQHHYQIQWELDKPFYSKNWSQKDRFTCKIKNTYLSILEVLADIFGGDKNYKGLWHKNAYCTKGIRRIAITDSTVKLDDFVSWCEPFTKDSPISSRASYKERTSDKCTDPSLSRNCYMLSRLPSKVFYYMHDTGKLPDIDIAMEWAKKLEKESLKINGKKSIESDYLIGVTVKSVLDKCKQSYNESVIEKSDLKRELSLCVRRAKRGLKAIKAQNLLDKKTPKKEIAKLLDVNINTVTSYCKLSTDAIRDDLLSFLNFCSYNEVIGYRDLYNSVTEAFSLLY